MDSRPNEPSRAHSSVPKSKAFMFFSLLIPSLAIFITFTTTNHSNETLHLRSTLLLHKITRFLRPIQKSGEQLNLTVNSSPLCLLWMAPFLSGGGYSSEAWSYILALHDETTKNRGFRMGIEHHGDLENMKFWKGLPQYTRNLALELYGAECKTNETIVVCHSEPGAWNPPMFQTFPCPPTDYGDFFSVIGRTMFETDRVNSEHVERCNRMDFVWVPTEFHVSAFVQSGVKPSKVLKVVQAVDVNFFDPYKYKPLDLASIGSLVLGSSTSTPGKEFVFLSVFKWEKRKGWDVLLKSYLEEFSKTDRVALYLLTNPYHSDSDFGNKIVEFVEDSDMENKAPVHGWAPIYVIDEHIAQVDLPKLYKAANAFVLPSRGEGWGRPLVEAMSMSLPVIATNWSGPTEYLTEENSYPLPVDAMSEVREGPFTGHLWAETSVPKLRVLMRQVMSNVEEAEARGRKGREDMIRRFSPKIVAGIVTEHVRDVIKKNS